MKSFIVASLAMLVFLTVASAAPNQSPDNAQPTGQVCNIKDENGQDDVFAYSEVEPYLNQLAAAAFCPGDGLVFNGKKTCQIGCRAACVVPTCGGYKECEQIPNERLHKYRCHCNK